jgi:hypothetical protein
MALSNTSLFIFHCGSDTLYLLLYVDNIILTTSRTELLCHTISALQREFAMKYPGPLHQHTYTLDVIKRAVMADCKPFMTSVDLQEKLAADFGPLVQDVTQLWRIACALQYLTFTQPDIVYII